MHSRIEPTVSTASALPLARTILRGSLWQYHIDDLPADIIRRVLAYLDARHLRRAAQVCIRWHILGSDLIAALDKVSRVSVLPWYIMKRVFGLLDLADLRIVARTCARWRFITYGFFSLSLGRQHIHNLPAESINYIFSFLEFESVRTAAQVCVRWRDQGIDHPVFWQNIEARSATLGSLELLAARLGQTMGRPFSLTIDIECPQRLIQTRLMDLLAAMMPTVQKLHICLSLFYIRSLWAVLNNPAPELTSFLLKLYTPDVMANIPLNPWIFGNLPGKLEDVCIEDVKFETSLGTLGYPAFANVRHLRLIYTATQLCPAHLFEICPNLRSLSISCVRLELGRLWSSAALDGLGRLDSLELQTDLEARDEFVSRMPMWDHIPVITMHTPPSDDAANDFLAGLRHPFIIALIDGGDSFNISVQDSQTGYTRRFVELKQPYACDPSSNHAVNVLFENGRFSAGAEFLRISLSLWDLLVPYLARGYFTALAKLVINIKLVSRSAHRTQPLLGKPLEFSKLETLVLETSEVFVYVLIDDVLNFVDNVLHAHRCRILDLRRVLLKGYDVAPLGQRFDKVLYSNKVYSGSPSVLS